MQSEYWKKIITTTLLSHPRLTVVEDDVVLPDGTQTKYMRWENLADYVTVIAERDGMIALNKEYSYPHDEIIWQFPEGSIESGEEPELSARRELAEEAGLKAGSLRMVGMNYGHHRRSNEKNYIFVANGVSEIEKPAGDKEEVGTTTHWVPVDELCTMIYGGQIRQKNALAALSLYFSLPARDGDK